MKGINKQYNMNYATAQSTKLLCSNLYKKEILHNGVKHYVNEIIITPSVPVELNIFIKRYLTSKDNVNALSGHLKQDDLQIMLYCTNQVTRKDEFVVMTKELLEQSKLL